MANSYDLYGLSGFVESGGTSLTATISANPVSLTSGGTVSALVGAGVTDNSTSGGVRAYLGDVTNDPFVIKLSSNYQISLTYIGLMTYSLAGGGSTVGFVAENSTTGSYYLVVDHGLAPSGGTTGSGPTDNTATAGTHWNISAGAPGCFVAGTRIATPTGEVAVESLAAGDLVLTEDGQALPVRWAGRTTVSRVFADPVRMMPVRIKAGALGENLPVRDVLVSPGHAIRVGAVLAHAAALVNGTSILRENDMPMVFTYYHVELDSHALLLAEGAPAESFLEGVEDFGFDNADERERPAIAAEMAYPRIKSPRQLPAAARAQLAARAEALFGPVAVAA